MTVRAGDDIERVKEAVMKFVPDGFRDEDGVWHDGPLRRDALAALGRLQGGLATAEQALRRFLTDHDTDQLLATGKRNMCLCPDCLIARAALESRP